MDNRHLALWRRVVWRWVLQGASFSVIGWVTTVCSLVCVGGWAAFFTFASVLLWMHNWRHAWVFVTGLKRQTRMRTSWNVPSFIGRTRTCTQLRSEHTEDGMRTYCGQIERSVNEVVRVMDKNKRNGNEIELVTKRTWTGWSWTRTVLKRCT